MLFGDKTIDEAYLPECYNAFTSVLNNKDIHELNVNGLVRVQSVKNGWSSILTCHYKYGNRELYVTKKTLPIGISSTASVEFIKGKPVKISSDIN